MLLWRDSESTFSYPPLATSCPSHTTLPFRCCVAARGGLHLCPALYNGNATVLQEL